MKYLLEQVVPNLDQVESCALVAGQDAAQLTLALLKLMAQLINYADTVEKPETVMQHVFKALLVSSCSI